MSNEKIPSGKIRNAFETIQYRADKKLRDFADGRLISVTEKLSKAQEDRDNSKADSIMSNFYEHKIERLAVKKAFYHNMKLETNGAINSSTCAQAYWDRIHNDENFVSSNTDNAIIARAIIEKFHPNGNSTFDNHAFSIPYDIKMSAFQRDTLKEIEDEGRVESLARAKIALAFADAKTLSIDQKKGNYWFNSIGEQSLNLIRDAKEMKMQEMYCVSTQSEFDIKQVEIENLTHLEEQGKFIVDSAKNYYGKLIDKVEDIKEQFFPNDEQIGNEQ